MPDLENSGEFVASHKFIHTSKEPPLFFIMMRLNHKVILLCIVTIFGLSTLFSIWSTCGDHRQKNDQHNSYFSKLNGLNLPEEIDCDINNEYIIGCRKEGDEVFMPFTFLKKYFDIYGKLVSKEGLSKFEWYHSYSKIYHPKGKYDPRGVFMYFENYNVEVRDRVKCISAIEGVPVSTQWESQGYYYAIQIAQFGLSHYSKNLTDPEPRLRVLESKNQFANWIVPNGAHISKNFDDKINSRVLSFQTSEHYSEAIVINLDHTLDFVLSAHIVISGNSSLGVVLQNRQTNELYNLHYINSDILITTQDNNIYHGIGTNQDWKKLTRDLIIDLQKGLNYLVKDKSRHKIPRSKLKIVSISLHGYGRVANLTLSTSEHMQQFYNTAEWFVRHQNAETGGWAIPVRRHLATGFSDLKPGWYSAMGQGHALSVLARAYYQSGNLKYLKAAVSGLKPFRVSSEKGGVLATFLGKFRWYEEYPTDPASYVLNGFVYSLLGLYDLMTIAPLEYAREAELLYRQGIASLKGMLPLYDMGSVTAYDLRHFSLGIAPNLARWDYHATHVNQLLLLSTIENDPVFKTTAERWIGYMYGKRAAHN